MSFGDKIAESEIEKAEFFKQFFQSVIFTKSMIR